MDAKLIRIDGNTANQVTEIVGNMNIIFQHDSMFAGRLHDHTPGIRMALKATDFRGAQIRSQGIGPVEILLPRFIPIHCGDTRMLELLSSQLLLHPIEPVNIFIKVYNIDIQNSSLNNRYHTEAATGAVLQRANARRMCCKPPYTAGYASSSEVAVSFI